MPREFTSADEFVQRFLQEIESDVVGLKPGMSITGIGGGGGGGPSFGGEGYVNWPNAGVGPTQRGSGFPAKLHDFTEFRMSFRVTTADLGGSFGVQPAYSLDAGSTVIAFGTLLPAISLGEVVGSWESIPAPARGLSYMYWSGSNGDESGEVVLAPVMMEFR